MVSYPGCIRSFYAEYSSLLAKPEHIGSLTRLDMLSTKLAKDVFSPGIFLVDCPAGLHYKIRILASPLALLGAYDLGIVTTKASSKPLDPATMLSSFLLGPLRCLKKNLALGTPALHKRMRSRIGG
jgi:hypothetical protein